MKIPTYLKTPSTSWVEANGMRRAIAVLKAEAAVLRKQGFALQPAALMTVAKALQGAITKENARSEAAALCWEERLANPSADDPRAAAMAPTPPKDAP